MPALSFLPTRTLSILLLLAALSGCVSVKSNVDPDFDQPLNRVFVAMEGGGESGSVFEEDLERLGSQIASQLSQRGIASDVYVRKELSLEMSGTVEAQIESFNPDAILIVSQTRGEYINGARTGQFEAALLAPGRERLVWRALVTSGSEGLGGGGSASQIAGKIIGKMSDDGLFSRTGEPSPAPVSEHTTI